MKLRGTGKEQLWYGRGESGWPQTRTLCHPFCPSSPHCSGWAVAWVSTFKEPSYGLLAGLWHGFAHREKPKALGCPGLGRGCPVGTTKLPLSHVWGSLYSFVVSKWQIWVFLPPWEAPALGIPHPMGSSSLVPSQSPHKCLGWQRRMGFCLSYYFFC